MINYNNMWRLADRFFRIAQKDGYGDAWMGMLCARDAASVEAVINAVCFQARYSEWPQRGSYYEAEKIAGYILRALDGTEEEDRLWGKKWAIERLQRALKEWPARKVKP